MGLASKLAAAGAVYATAQGMPPMGMPGQQPPPGHSPYPQQPGQGMPPAGYASPYSQQPAPGGAPTNPAVLAAKLQSIVDVNQLHNFYPPARVQALAAHIAQTVNMDDLAARWRLPRELAMDLVALALYDVIIYADDSGSMRFEQGGERIEDLKLIMAKVAEIASLYDSDGIQVRFINSDAQGNGIRCANDANALVSQLQFTYDTKLAGSLESKVLQPLVYSRVDQGTLAKPVLVITITDGEPSDSPKDKILQVIQEARQRTARYGPKVVAFEFAQVGNDAGSQRFLARLDNDPQVGSSIDCTSNYELEAAEMARKGVNMTVEGWLCKLMCGAIDPTYDHHD